MTMHFNEIPQFSKDFKHYAKKYKSLPEDFEEFKKVVGTIPFGISKHFNIITRYSGAAIVKARLF